MARRKRDGKKDYCVFLSHSSRDQWISLMMREKIEEKGISVWLDAFDLPGGANVKERIKEGMRASDECLILLSPTSQQSDWVKHEAGLADALDKWTTLLLLHVNADEVPDPSRDLKFLELNEFPSYIDQLTVRASRKP
jgi:TIR domain